VSDNNTAEKALAVVAAHLSAERPGLRRLFKGRVLFSGSGGMGGLRTAVGLVDGEDATGDGGGEGGWDVIQSDLTRRFTASRMRGRLYHPGGHPVSVAEAAALVALKGVSRAVRAGVAPWCDGKDAWHQTIFGGRWATGAIEGSKPDCFCVPNDEVFRCLLVRTTLDLATGSPGAMEWLDSETGYLSGRRPRSIASAYAEAVQACRPEAVRRIARARRALGGFSGRVPCRPRALWLSRAWARSGGREPFAGFLDALAEAADEDAAAGLPVWTVPRDEALAAAVEAGGLEALLAIEGVVRDPRRRSFRHAAVGGLDFMVAAARSGSVAAMERLRDEWGSRFDGFVEFGDETTTSGLVEAAAASGSREALEWVARRCVDVSDEGEKQTGVVAHANRVRAACCSASDAQVAALMREGGVAWPGDELDETLRALLLLMRPTPCTRAPLHAWGGDPLPDGPDFVRRRSRDWPDPDGSALALAELADDYGLWIQHRRRAPEEADARWTPRPSPQKLALLLQVGAVSLAGVWWDAFRAACGLPLGVPDLGVLPGGRVPCDHPEIWRTMGFSRRLVAQALRHRVANHDAEAVEWMVSRGLGRPFEGFCLQEAAEIGNERILKALMCTGETPLPAGAGREPKGDPRGAPSKREARVILRGAIRGGHTGLVRSMRLFDVVSRHLLPVERRSLRLRKGDVLEVVRLLEEHGVSLEALEGHPELALSVAKRAFNLGRDDLVLWAAESVPDPAELVALSALSGRAALVEALLKRFVEARPEWGTLRPLLTAVAGEGSAEAFELVRQALGPLWTEENLASLEFNSLRFARAGAKTTGSLCIARCLGVDPALVESDLVDGGHLCALDAVLEERLAAQAQGGGKASGGGSGGPSRRPLVERVVSACEGHRSREGLWEWLLSRQDRYGGDAGLVSWLAEKAGRLPSPATAASVMMSTMTLRGRASGVQEIIAMARDSAGRSRKARSQKARFDSRAYATLLALAHR